MRRTVPNERAGRKNISQFCGHCIIRISTFQWITGAKREKYASGESVNDTPTFGLSAMRWDKIEGDLSNRHNPKKRKDSDVLFLVDLFVAESAKNTENFGT